MYVQTIHRKGNPMNNTPHARAFDLPGWPCPPRARDIATTPNSWGWVVMTGASDHGVAQDDLGRLWANGDKVPKPTRGTSPNMALLAWTEKGLAVYVPPENYGNLPDVTLLDASPDQWIPIAAVLVEPPKESRL